VESEQASTMAAQ